MSAFNRKKTENGKLKKKNSVYHSLEKKIEINMKNNLCIYIKQNGNKQGEK